MRLLSVIGSQARKRFPRPVRQTLVGLLLIVLVSQTVLGVLAYRAAVDHLRQNDPRQLQNRSEVSFFFAPLRLQVGSSISSGEVIEYLGELGYVESADETPGSFKTGDNTITVTPRAVVFQQLSIRIERHRIDALTAGGQPVMEVQLEPLPMQEFVRYLQNESLREQRVRRTVLVPGAVPELLSDAVISIEDRRFFQHHGIDVFGIARRVLSGQGGGSSLTQQLIKNTIFKGAKGEFWQKYLSFLPANWQRKATDVFLALAAEKMMSKDEILAAYLSVVPLGAAEGVELHGVAVAAQEYFGKNLYELDLAEAAALAGMIHKPSFYLGRARDADYNAITDRRNSVLDLMGRNLPSKYSAAVIDRAKRVPMQFVFANSRRSERPAAAYSRHFVEFAAHNLTLELAQVQSSEGALHVSTTLDFRLQKEATEIAESAARELQKPIARVCRASRTDKVRCSALVPQVALVAMDPQTGQILAMVGGINSNFNYATAKRSPGSVIKPFIYLRSIQRGHIRGQAFTPATILDPQTDELRGYRPEQNIGRKSTVRVGLAKSYNFHAVAAAEAAGLNNTVEFLSQLTGSHPEVSGMAAIGGTAGSETSLLSLVQAYTVFPNNGRLATATFQRSFEQAGVTKDLASTEPRAVADAGAAYVVTQMMRSVVGPRGTAPDFLGLAGFNSDAMVAAKSGTGMVADVWFVALTPRLVVGVWTGLPQNEIPLRLSDGFSGARVAAPIVAKFMRSVRRVRAELLTGDFQLARNVTRLRIDPNANCTTTGGGVEEYFIIGREPPPCRQGGRQQDESLKR